MAFGASRGVDPSLLAGDVMDRQIATMFRERLVNDRAADIIVEAATRKAVPLSDLAEELQEASDDAEEGRDEPTEDSDDA
jgi:hypothetical protein